MLHTQLVVSGSLCVMYLWSSCGYFAACCHGMEGWLECSMIVFSFIVLLSVPLVLVSACFLSFFGGLFGILVMHPHDGSFCIVLFCMWYHGNHTTLLSSSHPCIINPPHGALLPLGVITWPRVWLQLTRGLLRRMGFFFPCGLLPAPTKKAFLKILAFEKCFF